MNNKNQISTLEYWVKISGVFVAIAGLVFGIVRFTSAQSIEAARPYLEQKLSWCTEATETAASIAVAGNENLPEHERRFWVMYWGVMGMVENDLVTKAMVAFGKGINGELPGNSTLRDLSLGIAHACRVEMSNSWSPIWSL